MLHPCFDTPEQHLEFLDSGVVRARGGSQRGAATIFTLGLNRRGLTDARRDHVVMVQAALKRLRDAERNEREYPQDPAFVEQREVAVAELARMLAPDRPYSMLVAQYLGLAP